MVYCNIALANVCNVMLRYSELRLSPAVTLIQIKRANIPSRYNNSIHYILNISAICNWIYRTDSWPVFFFVPKTMLLSWFKTFRSFNENKHRLDLLIQHPNLAYRSKNDLNNRLKISFFSSPHRDDAKIISVMGDYLRETSAKISIKTSRLCFMGDISK